MPDPRPVIFAALCAAVVAPPVALATTYEVGPGQPYTSIGAVPWESLAAGDTVLIHARPQPYLEKWVVNARGSEAAPITVRGVADASGALPVIDGAGATTRPNLDFWNEERGVIKIGGSNTPPDGTPSWIVVEGLHVRNAHTPYTFTGRYGTTAYVADAAAIYVEKGQHVTVRGCELESSGNGLFIAAGTSDAVVEGNFIHDDGNAGSAYEHGSYTEALGIVFQDNRYGPLAPGAEGNALKDRSAGTVIRFNWIEGGNRALDLVDSDDAALLADPRYADTLVYGNVLVKPDSDLNTQVVHFGGDSGDAARYRTALHMWNNTVVSTRTDHTTLLRLSSPAQRCELRNNLVFAAAGGTNLSLVDADGDVDYGGNWMSVGWRPSFGTATGALTDVGGNHTGADPGFVDLAGQDFHLAAGSPALGQAIALTSTMAAAPLDRQYVKHQRDEPRPADGHLDVGAFEGSGGSGSGSGGTVDGVHPGSNGGDLPSPPGGGCAAAGDMAGALALAALLPLAARARRRRARPDPACPRA